MTHGIAARTTRGWAVLISRMFAIAFLVAALVLHGDVRLVPIVFLVACALVLFVLRNRAPSIAGAEWSGSANLLLEGRKYSGQLSLADGRAVWSPTDRSRHQGINEISVDVVWKSGLTFEAGQALLDVIVTVSASDGQYRFLTHRGLGLQRAIRHLEM